MPRAILRSAGHALRGLAHGFMQERNMKLFLAAYLLVVLAGLWRGLAQAEWLALVLAGGLFFVSELLNTALERLADVLDDHWKREECHSCFEAVKTAKDVAAAASLVSLLVTIIVVLAVFTPKL